MLRSLCLRLGAGGVVVTALAAFVLVGVLGPTLLARIAIFFIALVVSGLFLCAGLLFMFQNINVIKESQTKNILGAGTKRSSNHVMLVGILAYSSAFVIVPLVISIICIWQLLVAIRNL